MVAWAVSQVDVEQHPKYGKVSLDNILHSYGMNISRGYIDDSRWKEPVDESEDSESRDDFYHRSPFTGEVYKGPRYVGEARQDGKWRRFVSNFLELPLE